MKRRKKSQRNQAALLWISQVSGRKKWSIFLLSVLQSVLGLTSIGYALLLRRMIDGAVAGENRELVFGSILLALLILMQILMRAVGRYLEEEAKATLENRMKARLFSHLLSREYAGVSAVHSGEWINRLTSDTVVVTEGVVQILPQASGMIVKMVGALLMILILEPGFGAVIVPGGIFLLFFSTVFRRQMKKLHRGIQEKDGKLRVFLQERLGSMLIVRSFAMEEQTMKDAKARMEDHKQARMKRSLFSTICNMGFSAVMQGVYLAGAIYCCFGIASGSVTYGTLMSILQLISQIQSPMANLTGFLPKYYAMTASAERLMEVESLKDAIEGERKPLEEVQRYYKERMVSFGLEHARFTYLPPGAGDDEMQRMVSGKERMPVVLKNAAVEICKGDYVSITGQSGCGKSTILKLLMCLYPLDEGERYLKEVDGFRIALTGIWQKLFSYVPQGNYLMSGTIREIIALGNPERMKEEEEMRRAITIACADEFVFNLEKGFDTFLGERGQGLSDGQMQRIAIARAVFSDNPILILDEATSALDEATEVRILDHLRAMTDKTVLIVTHRPAALAICNKHIVIRKDGLQMTDEINEHI